QLVFVDELDVRQHDLAAHLDVDVVAAVDHDLGYAVIADQGLDRPKLLVVLVDVDTRDPDCHSASLQLANYHGAAIASPTFDRRTPTIHSRARPRPQLRAPIR